MEGFVHPDFAPVTEKVQQLMAKKSARGGMAVAVYHHGELVVDAWTGVRNASGDPWARDTMSMSFSTTKGVVATIVPASRRPGSARLRRPRRHLLAGVQLQPARTRSHSATC